MDCFYAAVEMRDNPSLVGKPVIVGGDPDSRGVVATCSYEARRFGIHSAMSCRYAQRLCPQAIFIRPSFEKYREVSSQIRFIFKQYTDLVEPLSLDEAYLDVSSHKCYAMDIAKLIKQKITKETQLTGSAGVAPNKLIAKIASDLRKPDGLTVVHPVRVSSFMENLPLRKISGIGPATESRLKNNGYIFCKDIWSESLLVLEERFGTRMSQWLFQRSRGIDERNINPASSRKSVSKETTFEHDISDFNKLKKILWLLTEEVSEMLKKNNFYSKSITLKLKRNNFKIITCSFTFLEPTCLAENIYQTAVLLLKNKIEMAPFRLIGLSTSNFLAEKQESFKNFKLDSKSQKIEKTEYVIDKIRLKFGKEIIKKGRSLN